MPRSAIPFLAFALLAVAGLVWMAAMGGEPAPSEDTATWAPDAPRDGPAEETRDERPTPDREPPDTAEPLVPRVLPPDAALEDVRDALYAGDPVSVAEAYASIARLAAQGAQSLQALQRQIVKTDDPAIRGVAVVATCNGGSESALRFAATRLMKPKMRGAGDIVGSFAALLLDTDAEGDALELMQLGRLPVHVGAVSPEGYAQKAITFFLDHTVTPGDEMGDLVEMCLRSIERSPALAELLVDGTRRRAYVAALPESDWARIRRVALKQALSDEARTAFAM